MRRPATIIVALLGAALALPSAAGAQSGNGLYEPFPKAAVEKRAKRFVERLRFSEPVRFTDAQLERGSFVDPRSVGLGEGLATAGNGAASERAGVGRDGVGIPLGLQIALAMIAVLSLPLLAGRRPARRVASS
jgi:hypothetical protein